MTPTTLFLDIGGVFLTNGWDHNLRKRACDHFNIDYAHYESLHHLTFDPFERGKLSLDDYLARTIFDQKRNFTLDQFKEFMFSESKPFPEMIEYIKELKSKYNLKTVVVSNEGKELNDYRIKKFRLKEFVDFFVSSCIIHLLKPDVEIFQLALQLSQVEAREVIFIENTPLFIEVARTVGITHLS